MSSRENRGKTASKPIVIFVDWHGVLSQDVFWKSVLSNKKHSYYSILNGIMQRLFKAPNDLLPSWILGQKKCTEVISELKIDKIGNKGQRYWVNLLMNDCVNMQLNIPLLATLKNLKQHSYLVIATDNMDCFAETVKKRKDLAFFDDILCSSDLGCLKKEDPNQFFGQWLAERSIKPENCFLIDDRKDNCEAFSKWGGNAIQLTYDEFPASKLGCLMQPRPNRVGDAS